MKHLRTLFAFILLTIFCVSASAQAPEEAAIAFVDPAMEACVRTMLDKPTEPITCADMEGITSFQCVGGYEIRSLADLVWCRNLESFFTINVPIENFEPLFTLPSLKEFVAMNYACVPDLSALEGRDTLKKFFLRGDGQSLDFATLMDDPKALNAYLLDSTVSKVDLTPLLSHQHLQRLELWGVTSDTFQLLMQSFPYLEMFDITSASNDKGITSADLEALEGMPLVTIKIANAKQVIDLTPLTKLEKLNCLWLYNCGVEDISPLRQIKTLRDGILDLRDNPVTDLSPLAGLGLYKLHITESDAYTLESVKKLLPGTIIEMIPGRRASAQGFAAEHTQSIHIEGMEDGDDK